MAKYPLPVNTKGQVGLKHGDFGTNIQCSENINPSAELYRALRSAILAAILRATPTLPLLPFFSALTFSNFPKLNKQLLPKKMQRYHLCHWGQMLTAADALHSA
jgi:hypothetical protein